MHRSLVASLTCVLGASVALAAIPVPAPPPSPPKKRVQQPAPAPAKPKPQRRKPLPRQSNPAPASAEMEPSYAGPASSVVPAIWGMYRQLAGTWQLDPNGAHIDRFQWSDIGRTLTVEHISPTGGEFTETLKMSPDGTHLLSSYSTGGDTLKLVPAGDGSFVTHYENGQRFVRRMSPSGTIIYEYANGTILQYTIMTAAAAADMIARGKALVAQVDSRLGGIGQAMKTTLQSLDGKVKVYPRWVEMDGEVLFDGARLVFDGAAGGQFSSTNNADPYYGTFTISGNELRFLYRSPGREGVSARYQFISPGLVTVHHKNNAGEKLAHVLLTPQGLDNAQARLQAENLELASGKIAAR